MAGYRVVPGAAPISCSAGAGRWVADCTIRDRGRATLSR